MEQLLNHWPLMYDSVQQLRPLTSEVIDKNGFNSPSFYADTTTRVEIAVHSLDHFNDLFKAFIETVSFDWVSNEKSSDVQILSDVQHPTQEEIQTGNNVLPVNSFLVKSPVYESTISSNCMIKDSTTEITQLQLMAPVSFNDDISMSISPSSSLSPITSNMLSQQTVLASPESSEDEYLIKLLEEMEPDTWNMLLSQPESSSSYIISENTFSMDCYLDVTISSPFHGSERKSDCFISSPSRSSENGSEDLDYIPPSKKEKLSKKSKPSEKEQNKNASTRYRMRKKQELELYLNEENKLLDKNKELCTHLDELTRELKCLKSLIRDIYRKKVLIK